MTYRHLDHWILSRLKSARFVTVKDLALKFGCSVPAMGRHVKKIPERMLEVRLVRQGRRGRLSKGFRRIR